MAIDAVAGPPADATEGSPVGPPPGATAGTPVGPPAGATEGAPVGPPPGATAGAPVGPQQPQSLGDRIKAGLADTWAGKGVDPFTNMNIGVVKQGLGLIGGLMKIAHDKVGMGPQPSDVLEYKQANPGATDEQAMDAVNKGYRGPTTQASREKTAARADWLLRNSDTKGFFQSVGGLGENIGELVGLSAAGDPEAGGRAASELVGDASKTWKFLEGNGLLNRLARIGFSATKNAGEQYAQTYAHTGGDTSQAGTAAMIAAPLGAAGQGLGEGYGAYKQFMARAAQDIAPVERELEGSKFLQLASELVDSEGRPTAPPRAQNVQIGDQPGIMRDRIAAFKQMQTNMAKNAITSMVDDTNKAVAGAGVGDIMPTQEGGGWRYIPPDGSASLNEPEARSALDKLKQEWLGTDWSPEDNHKYQDAYNDLQNQLGRNDSYAVTQPYQLHNTQDIANATESWRDAANQAESLARAKTQQLGLSQEYQKLLSARDSAQEALDKALQNPDPNEDFTDLQRAEQGVKDAGTKLLDFVKEKGTQPELNKVIAQRAEQEQTTANAFRELSNAYDRHMSILTPTAEQISGEGFTRPQMPRRLTSLSDDIEKIRTKYGDVLNPLIGENGLNHIIELGDMLETPRGNSRAGGMLDMMAADIKRQMHMGWKAGLHYGGLFGLGSLVTHSVGGGAAVTGLVATRAAYKSMLNEIATNPAKARAVIEAAKSTAPIEKLGPQLSRLFGVSATNAMRNLFPPPTSQRNNSAAQPQPQRDPNMVESNPKGLVERGNIPIWNRPVIQNADGSHSSELSLSMEDDKGREVLIPTIANGKFLTPDGKMPPGPVPEDWSKASPAWKALRAAAWKRYEQTGEHLGKFDNPDNADAYANKLHNR